MESLLTIHARTPLGHSIPSQSLTSIGQLCKKWELAQADRNFCPILTGTSCTSDYTWSTHHAVFMEAPHAAINHPMIEGSHTGEMHMCNAAYVLVVHRHDQQWQIGHSCVSSNHISWHNCVNDVKFDTVNSKSMLFAL